MIQRPLLAYLILMLSVVALNGCRDSGTNGSGPDSANSSSKSRTKDEIEELRDVIEIPFEAEEVAWQEHVVGAGEASKSGRKQGSRHLVAVFRFEGANAQKFNDFVRGLGNGEPATVPVEPWFPAELIAKSQTGPEGELKGQAFAAEKFQKGPFKTGRMFRVDGADYCILEMFAD